MQINWHPTDDGLDHFIREYLDSFCSWDLLVFLAHNPDSVDTARGLATRIGRPVPEITQCLARLVQKGVVEGASAFGDEVFRLSADQDLLAVLNRFARQQGEPSLRAAAVRRIMAETPQAVPPV
jgi:hypothetical protein